jgi:hypothetical protein
MDSITGIIDVDGFTVEKRFYCKELAMIKKNECHLCHIHTLPWLELESTE